MGSPQNLEDQENDKVEVGEGVEMSTSAPSDAPEGDGDEDADV